MRTFQTLPGDHRFFSVMAIVIAVTIVAGFSSVRVERAAGPRCDSSRRGAVVGDGGVAQHRVVAAPLITSPVYVM